MLKKTIIVGSVGYIAWLIATGRLSTALDLFRGALTSPGFKK